MQSPRYAFGRVPLGLALADSAQQWTPQKNVEIVVANSPDDFAGAEQFRKELESDYAATSAVMTELGWAKKSAP